MLLYGRRERRMGAGIETAGECARLQNLDALEPEEAMPAGMCQRTGVIKSFLSRTDAEAILSDREKADEKRIHPTLIQLDEYYYKLSRVLWKRKRVRRIYAFSWFLLYGLHENEYRI